jgi:periplasmic copper chaperone A
MKEATTVRRSILVAVAALLLAPAAAQAHVTLQPDTAPAGGFTRLDVRVPNERDDAGTTKVDVQLPPGFIAASYEPVPGWKVEVTRSKADEPIDTGEGLKSDTQVSRITWTGDGKQGIVEPGEFQDFGLSLKMPEGQAGDKLTFKALQTYDDGQVVRWIGPEDAEEPAPIVTLEAGSAGGGHGAPAASAGGSQQQTSAPASAPAASDDSGTDTLSIVAVILGALALIAALGALAAARRSASSAKRRKEVAA